MRRHRTFTAYGTRRRNRRWNRCSMGGLCRSRVTAALDPPIDAFRPRLIGLYTDLHRTLAGALTCGGRSPTVHDLEFYRTGIIRAVGDGRSGGISPGCMSWDLTRNGGVRDRVGVAAVIMEWAERSRIKALISMHWDGLRVAYPAQKSFIKLSSSTSVWLRELWTCKSSELFKIFYSIALSVWCGALIIHMKSGI